MLGRNRIPFRKALGLSKSDCLVAEIFAAARLLMLLLCSSYFLYEMAGAYNYEFGRLVMQVVFWFGLMAMCTFSQQHMFKVGQCQGPPCQQREVFEQNHMGMISHRRSFGSLRRRDWMRWCREARSALSMC